MTLPVAVLSANSKARGASDSGRRWVIMFSSGSRCYRMKSTMSQYMSIGATKEPIKVSCLPMNADGLIAGSRAPKPTKTRCSPEPTRALWASQRRNGRRVV